MARPISDEHRSRFKKNLDLIRKNFPALYRKILLHPDDPPFEMTPGGTLTMKMAGRYVESRYGPDQKTDRPAELWGNITYPGQEPEGDAQSIYLGCGLGYLINQVQQNRGGTALVVEKDIELFKASLYIIEPAVLQTLTLLVDEDVSVVERALAKCVRGRTWVVEHGRGSQFHREYYQQVKEAFRNLLKSSIASDITTRATMRVWIRNVLKNLFSPCTTCYGTVQLSGAFAGPVILVSSGPFLEEIIDDLRTWSINIPLFTLLPSVSYLKSEGIMPDFAVTTDAGFWNRYRFTREVTLPLITTYSADPVLLRNWRGSRFFFSHDLSIEQIFTSVGDLSLKIPMQGTASIVMILLARLLGFTDIFIAGYDFSFLGLKDHHSGGGFEKFLLCSNSRIDTWETTMLRRLRGGRLMNGDDCNGSTVLSTHTLMLYRNWLEREVDLACIRRLNNGARIEGLSMARKDDLDVYGPEVRIEFQRRLKKQKVIPINSEKISEDFHRLLRLVETGQDFPTLMEIHNSLFGQRAGTSDEESVRSDIAFVRKELSRVRERMHRR